MPRVWKRPRTSVFDNHALTVKWQSVCNPDFASCKAFQNISAALAEYMTVWNKFGKIIEFDKRSPSNSSRCGNSGGLAECGAVKKPQN